ncbi:Sensor histidine kinase LiaS [Pontiella desulfatans]|uniref:Sensor histidine kinase LiaS n=1 Tax=Pontiella desulfatans TaxID=2750659 RepID=A0A6C2TX22_PONDE|nr:histidine kinase [Pontiella desulfatans]VGO12220.1 Sensor histidine kinase LiaS [Pontiella desulfatans]
MCRIFTICIAALLAGILPGRATPLATRSLSQLEQRLVEIDAELGQLAHYSLRSGIGSIGFRSIPHETANQTEWIEIQLDQETPLDEIVLVPTIRRDTQEGFQADGFPDEFRILAGTADHLSGTVLGEYRSADGILPREAPLVIPAKGILASWIRIEATRLSQRAFDGKHVFQLSEVLLFSGGENMALRQPVKVSSNHPERADSAWNVRYLVDGHTPYLMDAAQGLQSVAYASPSGKQPVLALDLGESVPLSRIHLHALEQSDTVPQAFAGDLGIPKNLRIEGANQPDFSDAIPLLETRQESVNDTGPIMMWRIPETPCRHIRIFDATPNTLDPASNTSRIGFAEIELFSKGRNVALGKTVKNDLPPRGRALSALTDGRNFYGNILPVRDWLNELARRHALETERPLVVEQLNLRYARQKATLHRMSWLAALLVAAVAFTILIDRMLRLHQIARIRERFAADLHDELGANLHAIGLLGDLAKDAVHSPDELIETVDEIRALTERSGAAARHCADMQQADIFGKLPDDMRRTARRIMADVEYTISIEGEAMLEKLKPRTKADLFLFYKESLVNISRHSGATKVAIELNANREAIHLTITDNGLGLEGDIPSSLKRRARLLGGHVTTSTSESGGTCIALKLKPIKFRFRN